MLKHCIFLVILLFAGCATSPIDLSEIKSLPEDQGIVFGRVKVIEGGKTENLSSIFGESIFGVIILPDNSSKAIYVPLKNDGSFIWHLAEGGYTIASFEWFSYGRQGRIFAYYTVLKNKATYIGTLTLSFSGGRYEEYVVDEYELTSRTIKSQFPEMKQEVIRSLMQMEKRR
jgi:hypothetical protein